MNDFEILPLFPSAVLKTQMKRSLTKAELKAVNKLKTKIKPNIGNITSQENYVLDKPEFKEIKEFIDSVVEDYMDNVVQPKYDTTAYVTQSWLNWTEPGGYHHNHFHPNSFISGVFYINASGDSDRISFARERHDHFDIEAGEYNLYNSKVWWIGVSTGTLILFPSHITHSVPNTESDTTRISLAFNTYLRGQLGVAGFGNGVVLK